MNISYKWLKEYVDFDLTPEEVCAALTSTGLEVDASLTQTATTCTFAQSILDVRKQVR